MKKETHLDVAIVGAGIVGLAHAYVAASKGYKVAVFEKNARAVDASILNFGLIWPIGQPAGKQLERAYSSREIWKNLSKKAGFWLNKNGSLHLAYQKDEMEVLVEFAETAHQLGYDFRLLNPDDVLEKSMGARKKHLFCGLWSKSELTVDPREVLKKIPLYLKKELDVQLFYNTPVTGIAPPKLYSGTQTWTADRIFVCNGSDFETLFPEVFQQSGLIRCKLQMMRTKKMSGNWQLGPTLCGGLAVQYQPAFQACSSLEKLKKRVHEEFPDMEEFGIDGVITQHEKGELVIGNSHEYGLTFDPFINEKINKMMVDYVKDFTKIHPLKISDRWHGIYALHPEKPEFIHQPEPGVTLVTGLGKSGMTLAFGLAEELIE